MAKRYRVTLTENQMRVVEKCCEWYFRLMMGQASGFADEIASAGRDIYNGDNPNHERIFIDFLIRKNHIEEIMRAVYQIAYEPDGFLSAKTGDMMAAEGIWEAVRFALGHSRWRKPMQVGDEPLPLIVEDDLAERLEDDGK